MQPTARKERAIAAQPPSDEPVRESARGSRWFILAGDEHADPSWIPAAALAAAPPGVADGGVLLPRDVVDGRCRLCGRTAELTREHVPPRAAGNTGRVVAHTVEDWVRRETLDDPPVGPGRVEQGGVWGRVLCHDCNSITGHRYGSEYRGWAARATRMLSEDLPPPEVLDAESVSRGLRVRFDGVRPGAFARQVLSLMATLSGPWDLAGRHPEIRSMVLDGTPGRLPDGMFLGMTFYAGPNIAIAGPSLRFDRVSGAWQWVLALAFPPLAFEMVLAESTSQPTAMCGIDCFLAAGPEVVGNAELEVFVAFGHTASPTDWRTRAQLERGLTLEGKEPTDLNRGWQSSPDHV